MKVRAGDQSITLTSIDIYRTKKDLTERENFSIEYRSDDVTKMIFLKLWDMISYSYRGS